MSLLTSKLWTYNSWALGRTDLWEEKKLQALNNGKALRLAFRAYLAHHLEMESTIYRFAQASGEWHRVCPLRQLKIVSLIGTYKQNMTKQNMTKQYVWFTLQNWCTHVQSRKLKINHYRQGASALQAVVLIRGNRVATAELSGHSGKDSLIAERTYNWHIVTVAVHYSARPGLWKWALAARHRHLALAPAGGND